MNKVLSTIIVVAGLTLSVSGAGRAADSAATAADPSEIGQQTRTWLEMQRRGQTAGLSHSLSAEAANLSYQRYLKSFTHPIPEFYRPPQEGFSGGGSGGGGGGRR